MLRKYFISRALGLLLCMFASVIGFAQNVGINATGAVPDASAGLDIDFASKGILIPRVALQGTADITTIPIRTTSVLVYNTTYFGNGTSSTDVTPGYYFWNGSAWTPVGSSTTGGILIPRVALTSTADAITVSNRTISLLVFNTATAGSGGTAVTPGFYFWYNAKWNILSTGGTSPFSPWSTANTTDIYNNNTGSVGIGGGGSPTFSVPNAEKLLVDAGTTSNNVIVGKANVNGFVQLNIINTSPGTGASSDVVATNNFTGQTKYIDMGINSATNNSTGVLGGNNTAYLHSTGGDLAIGNSTAAEDILFFTNPSGTTLTERMRITSTGALGFGSPANTGSNGYVLTSSGTGAPPTWSDASSTLAGFWNRTGNSNIDTTLNFLGTTNLRSVVFKANNTESMRINTKAQLVVGGTTNFSETNNEKMIVDGGTDANEVLGVYGNINGYVQMGVKNISNGNDASSDVVATANNGTETSNYIDMGINSSSYQNNKSNILNTANLGYLYSNSDANFKIGNGGLGKSLVFFTNKSAANGGTLGALTAKGFERMKIDGTGNVGIGEYVKNNGQDSVITYKLTVDGICAPRSNNDYTLGSSAHRWSTIYVNKIGNSVTPTDDNTFDFGSTLLRWKTLWSNNTLNSTSDRRLKTNITNLTYGLKEIMALQPVTYNWKTTPNTDKKIGLIAQDVREVLPEVVHGDEAKENLSMSHSDIIPVLINAIKEQQKQIDELKKQVQTLQNK